MSLVTGSSFSYFRSVASPRFIEVLLPLANSDRGLRETVDILKKEATLANYSISQRIDGYRITFEFGFEDYATGATLLKFQTIIEAMKAGTRFELFPRVDNPLRKFEVSYVTDNFELLISRGGTFHKGFKAVFTTTHIVDNLDWAIVTPPTEFAVELDDIAFVS